MTQKLFTKEFIALNAVTLFAFFNMAVFYGFYNYLGTIGIPRDLRGVILGIEPMTAFILRPFVMTRLHARNSHRVMLLGLGLLAACLCSYSWALSIPTLALLRLIHGAAFVLLISASFTLVVNFIPAERSGQGFGVISTVTLIPYAVMPMLAEALSRVTGSQARIYAIISLFALPALGLLLAAKKGIDAALEANPAAASSRPDGAALRRNLADPRIMVMLAAYVMLYFSHATVFYFMKDRAAGLGGNAVGCFFAVSTAVIIGVRALGGVFFDRIGKLPVAGAFLILLIASFTAMVRVVSPEWLTGVAAMYGLSIGVALPLMNAVMFGLSPAGLRGFNTNLTLFMMDAGYFISPFLGGHLIASGMPVSSLFILCACLAAACLVCLAAVGMMKGNRKNPEETGV
ncbi:MAG: MFS transporter [Spirochaetes bacterium]|nr:MFS transporter [Spirochaetota bacterium]